MDSFGTQDIIFDDFAADNELNGLLGITDNTNNEQLNNKIYREELPIVQITPEALPFLYIVFINAHATNNFMVNKGVLELSVYAGTRYDAMNIIRACKEILQNNYEDYQIIHEGQVSSGVSGIYKYILRFTPLIES